MHSIDTLLFQKLVFTFVEIDSIFDSEIASFTGGIPKTRHISYLFLSSDETIKIENKKKLLVSFNNREMASKRLVLITRSERDRI